MGVKLMGGLNMRRALLIARRDYLGYIKTWGFWVSFFLPFVFGALFFFASFLDINLEPTRYEAILDDTGAHKASIITQYDRNHTEQARQQINAIAGLALPDEKLEELNAIIDADGIEAAVAHLNAANEGLGDSLRLPKKTMVIIDPPSLDIDVLKEMIVSEKPLMYNGQSVPLNGVLHIRSTDAKGVITADYWSSQVTAQTMPLLAKRYFRGVSKTAYLKSGGLTPEGLSQSENNAVVLQSYDPSKIVKETGGGQEVTQKDRIPYFVAGGMAMILWLTVFSGAYMLLTSMLEEKLNKLLEMMLATTNFGEIILGKLIGVAALTLTAMLPYILLGGGAMLAFIFFGDPEISGPIRDAFTWKMMVFFPLFLILGYIFYGCLFIAMGALAESMQDAQTITTPIVMVLTLCVLVVPLGWGSPDSPLLVFASWFPLSAPFAAISRLPSDPPAWELFLSAGFLALLSIGVILLASRIFRYGVLSGAGVKGISNWFKRTILRRKGV